MVSLIYHYSLSTSSAENDLPAVTLMSTDVDNLEANLYLILELWAYIVEVIIGVWLLWKRLGPVAIGPLLIMAVCSYVQTGIGKAMSTRRAVWTEAIQKRVALTSKLLRSMKSVKLTGMVEISAKLVQSERVRELELGKKYRWLVTWMNGVGKLRNGNRLNE
jgi:ATP-binding cassette, subfamily C (CFTR/MRP), member 1